MANEIRCPKCDSPSVTANKKGFSAGKALAGDLIAGPIGLLAGGMGSNKIIITCLACGHRFKPGDYQKKQEQLMGIKPWIDRYDPTENPDSNPFPMIVSIVFLIIVFYFLIFK